MGMYHKNRFVGPGYKRHIKRCTSRGMRRAAKKRRVGSCPWKRVLLLSY